MRLFCIHLLVLLSAHAAWADAPGISLAAQSRHLRSQPVLAPLPPTAGGSAVRSPDERLTFDGLLRTAMACNPTLAQARREIQALHGECLQVGLLPNPVVAYAADEIGVDGSAGFQGMAVAQEVVTAGKLGLNRAVVRGRIGVARRNLDIQYRRVQNDVTTAAYKVLAARRTLGVTEQLVEIGQRGERIAEQLFEGKEVSRVDILQARIEANEARLRRENARTEYETAWQRLAAVVGVPDMPPTTLEDRLDIDPPALDWQTSLASLLAASPELARAFAEVERSRSDLKRQIAGRVPNLELAAGVQQDTASGDTISAVEIGIPLQLFDRNQGNIRRARAGLAAAFQEVRRIELRLQERLAEAFKEYGNSRSQVEMYRQRILPDAEAGLELTQEGYRQGELGYLELLTSQRTYFHSTLAYVDSLKRLHVSVTRIEGMLLEGALDRAGE